MRTKEINMISLKPVVHLALASHEKLGYDYFPTLYSNIYICSRRRSGKTTLIFNILKHLILNISVQQSIEIEMLEKTKVNVMTYDHVLSGKEYILTGITEELKNDLELKEQEKIKQDEET